MQQLAFIIASPASVSLFSASNPKKGKVGSLVRFLPIAMTPAMQKEDPSASGKSANAADETQKQQLALSG